MAPEQMTPGADLDHRVDIYALGVVLYEMLTGVVPAGHFDPPSHLVPTLSTELDEIILQTLQPEPERRPSSAQQLQEHLENALRNPGQTRHEKHRTLALQALVASLAAAFLGAGAVLVWSTFIDQNQDPSGGQKTLQKPSALSIQGVGRIRLLNTTNLAEVVTPGQMVHALALSSSQDEFGVILSPLGKISTWGNNRFGQTDPIFEAYDIIGIAAGQGPRSAHALALRSDGSVMGWGDNTYGQAAPPKNIPPIQAIAAGELHSLALSVQGEIVAWGNPASGITSVPPQLLPVQAIAAGADFNLALQTNGAVLAWGNNQFGQCQVPSSLTGVVEIAAGNRHALIRLVNGDIVAWGDNSFGQCTLPTNLPPATAVFAGAQASAILDERGQLHSWGRTPSNLPSLNQPIRHLAIGSTSWIALE
jgi:hypothetical protein